MPNKYPNHEILPSVYLTLGTYYYRQSDFQNALLSFQEVLDNTQGRDLWPTALKNLELTYKDLGLYEAALSIVNRYLELFPYSEDALLKRLDAAQILLQLRDYDRAIQRLQDLLPLASQEMRVEAQFYLGEAYFQKGDFSQAVLEYMKVKYLDPGGGLDWAVTAIYNAGICYEKLGKLEEAKKMYQDIISRWGVNSDYGKGAKKRIDFLEQLKK
jgi:tetratricopeptide (TPR) repeat protein